MTSRDRTPSASTEARLSVRETFGAQAHNGHVLDQTVWNYHFEADPKTGAPTDKLNAAGIEHLHYLVRRQPTADPNVFLQTAQDVPGAATLTSDKLSKARSDLDNKRVAAIQKYLAGATSGHGQMVAYQVAVHDPAEVGISGTAIGGSGSLKNPVIKGAVQELQNNYRGKMPGPDGMIMTGTGGGGG